MINRSTIKIFFLLLLLGSVVYYYNMIKEANTLHAHGLITEAIVYNVFDAYRSDTGFEYYFFINGEKVYGRDYFKISMNIERKIKDKKVPVIYLPSDPSNNQLILTQNNFEGLGLNYPDSLMWIENYIMY